MVLPSTVRRYNRGNLTPRSTHLDHILQHDTTKMTVEESVRKLTAFLPARFRPDYPRHWSYDNVYISEWMSLFFWDIESSLCLLTVLRHSTGLSFKGQISRKHGSKNFVRLLVKQEIKQPRLGISMQLTMSKKLPKHNYERFLISSF
jgi:hypothetical protein